MPKKSSAYYQRQYRERLRAQGLVKKEVWILPDHAKTLSTVENLLREHASASKFQQGLHKLLGEHQQTLWTTYNLYDALQKCQMQQCQVQQHSAAQQTTSTNTDTEFVNQLANINISLIADAQSDADGSNDINYVEPIIHLVMQDFGDLPIFLAVQGEQIIAETILCTMDEIKDAPAFNQMVLKTHKYFPLSTISLDRLIMSTGDAYDAYQMFGSLSASTSLQQVILEVHMLASNVMQALEAYSDYFKTSQFSPV